MHRSTHKDKQDNITLLENVAINNVLPLKVALREAIAILKSFWGPGHQRLNLDGFICIHCTAPPHSAGIVNRNHSER